MADVSVEKGEGTVTVEALDAQGEYRNFLHLQAAVLGPTGKKQTVQLEQTGPGRYEGRFAARDISAREVGAYLVNLMEVRDGRVVGAQTLGTSVNYSPEFEAAGSDMQLLSELARLGGGRLLALTNAAVATQNPFLHDRQRTFQPRDLWEWLLKIAVLAFVVDVGVRRIYLDRAEWLKATVTMRRYLLFWQRGARPAEADESLAALLARRDRVRLQKTAAGPQAPSSWSAPAPAPVPGVGTPAPPAAIKPAPAPSRIPAAAPADRGATAGRLLEAKRRAAKRLDR
jgi:hypothetical protein